MADDVAQHVAAVLTARGETLAVAESATGGLILSLLTDVPGASVWLRGGVVAYTNEAKRAVLNVPATVLATHGAVSEQTALAMAHGARQLFGATWALGETGVAGPQTGRRSAKPAGLTYIALVGGPGPGSGSGPDPIAQCRRLLVDPPGERAAVKRAFAEATLLLLLDSLQS